MEKTSSLTNTQEEEIDIDLKDPQVAKAAVFMQSGFRGLKARRQHAAKKVCTSLHTMVHGSVVSI